MSENKFTDNEIIKALECCSSNVLYENCVDCPYEKYLEKGHTCIIKATKSALDLINRQRAEIERLSSKIEKLSNEYPCGVDVGGNCVVYARSLVDYDRFIESVSTEAVKEFANSATDLCYKEFGSEMPVVHTFAAIVANVLDNFLKEMVGEDK